MRQGIEGARSPKFYSESTPGGLRSQIKGKVNALSVDSCQRLGVLFDDLVSSCELVNSTRVQVQVTGVVPIIAIDKCDGVQVRLPPAGAAQANA